MKLHFKGNYNGDPSTLPNQNQIPSAVKFREPELKIFAFISNGISLIVLIAFYYLGTIRAGSGFFNVLGFVLAFVSLVPHELLHALCFKNDVYFHLCLSKGLLFVVGEESMKRKEYVFMCLLPNIVFGFIPFLIFIVDPSLTLLGTLGVFAIGFGTGDYINVFNALTQMPKDALTYLYRENSYWYLPDKTDESD